MSAGLPIEGCNGSEVKWSHNALIDRKTSKDAKMLNILPPTFHTHCTPTGRLEFFRPNLSKVLTNVSGSHDLQQWDAKK